MRLERALSSALLLLVFFSPLTPTARCQIQTSPDNSQKTASNNKSQLPGGAQILSDTEGVDFAPFLKRWRRITKETWDKLMPAEVNRPTLQKGAMVIRFKVLPNGRLMDGGMALEGRSGDTALDRAAWGALTGSDYPPLPSEFHGPYVELRATFLYNMQASSGSKP